MTKTCTKCGEAKPFSEYHKHKAKKFGLQTKCKACSKEYKKQYQQTNKKAILEYQKQWYQANKEALTEKNKLHYQANKKALAEKSKQRYQANKEEINKYYRDRKANDPVFRMICNLRSGLGKTMNGTRKSKRTMELLSCSRKQLRRHLSAQFTEGMTLDNYGKWHIDHIVPVSSFDHRNPEQVAACWHYTNLQPLWAEDNLRKSDKLPHEI